MLPLHPGLVVCAVIRSQAETLGVQDLSEFDASTTTEDGNVAPLSHAQAKEGAADEEGWVAQGVTASGVSVQWFRHFGTAVPPISASDKAGSNIEDEPLLIVLANEYLLWNNSL